MPVKIQIYDPLDARGLEEGRETVARTEELGELGIPGEGTRAREGPSVPGTH